MSQIELSMALNHIRSRAAGEISLQRILKSLDPRTESRTDTIEELETKLPINIRLATSLFDAGKITEAEFVFHCGFHIVQLHEKCHLDGIYDSELQEITEKMEQIERRHGLKDNQYWLLRDAPAEYRRESERYDSALERKKIELFKKFAPLSLASRLENDATEFWKQYDLGRRSIFEKEDHLGAALSLLELYEREAQKSANAKAYYAAVTMLGSAAEARILLECIRQPAKTRAAIRRLSPKQRPSPAADPLKWNLASLINIANEAGWLPNIDDGEIVHLVSSWIHRLRDMRNLLHPGRHILEKPHVAIGHQEWLDADSAYTALRHAIETTRKTKRTRGLRKVK